MCLDRDYPPLRFQFHAFSFSFLFFFRRNCWPGLLRTVHLCTIYGSHKLHFSTTFSLKMGSTVLFIYLKIILLYYFQFSVFSFSKISFIQTDPKTKCKIISTLVLAKYIYLAWYHHCCKKEQWSSRIFFKVVI